MAAIPPRPRLRTVATMCAQSEPVWSASLPITASRSVSATSVAVAVSA
jgi:hypothetical protein